MVRRVMDSRLRGNDGQGPRCGYCLEASMTGRGWFVLCCFTLAFDSSPIKGEGIRLVVLACSPSPLIPLPSRERGFGWCCLVDPAPHLWIADQVRNDVTTRCIVSPSPPPCGYWLEASMTGRGLVLLLC